MRPCLQWYPGFFLYALSSTIQYIVLLTPLQRLQTTILKAGNVSMRFLCAFVFLWHPLFVHEKPKKKRPTISKVRFQEFNLSAIW